MHFLSNFYQSANVTDLANALDRESLNLLIAEPLAFIFDFGLLRFVHSYLKYLDKQRFLMKRFESFQFLYCSFMCMFQNLISTLKV